MQNKNTTDRLERAPSFVRLEGYPTTRLHRDERFCCGICTDPAVDPVLTCCGHLYCWPCLYQWLEPGMTVQERDLICNELAPQDIVVVPDVNNRTCPICKASCSIQGIIPIYVSFEDFVSSYPMDSDGENSHWYLDGDEDLTLSITSSQSFDSSESQSLAPLNIPPRPLPPSLDALRKLSLPRPAAHGDDPITAPIQQPMTEQTCSLSNAMVSLIQTLSSSWLDRHSTSYSPAPSPHRQDSSTLFSAGRGSGQRGTSDTDRAMLFYLATVATFAVAFIVCVDLG